MPTVSKCTKTIMIIIIINGKSFLERYFWRISIYIFENNLSFIKKEVVLHIVTLTHCKDRQVLHDLFSTNQGNGSETTFVAGATKINLKYLKTKL